LLLQEFLDGGIVDLFSGSRSGECDGANEQTVSDLLAGDAVFSELVEKLAGEDEVEEFIDLGEKSGLRGFFPGGAPEDGEDLYGGEQRSIAVGEFGRNLRSGCFGFTGMEGNDSDGVVKLGRASFWSFWTRLGRHGRLLGREGLRRGKLAEAGGKVNGTANTGGGRGFDY
jgi:hypothetical protein